MIKSIPIPLLLGKVEHYNKCPDFYSCLGTVPQLSGFRLTPLTAKGLPCRRCGAWRLPYTLNRKGSPLSAVRCVAVAFAVSVLECPKRKDSRFCRLSLCRWYAVLLCRGQPYCNGFCLYCLYCSPYFVLLDTEVRCYCFVSVSALAER